MRPVLSFVFILLCIQMTTPASGQDIQVDSTSKNLNKMRLLTVSGIHAVTIGGTLTALNQVWYKHYEKSKFHIKDDMGVWLQVDKFGHAYSAYSLAGPMSKMYMWSGLDRNKSVLLGSFESLGVLTAIELMDAYSAEWGFSYGDMGANVLGTVLYAGQELIWKEQIVQLKFSSRMRKYEPALLHDRANQIYGSNIAERLLKDYNTQSYWLAVSVHSFYRQWPKWLNIAVGYGGDDMYGAYYNTWKDVNGKYNDKSDIHRYRQYYLSLDVNLAAIETKYTFLNAVLDCLTIKIPAPTLEYNSQGFLKFHPLYY